jgi:hypothetical protein
VYLPLVKLLLQIGHVNAGLGSSTDSRAAISMMHATPEDSSCRNFLEEVDDRPADRRNVGLVILVFVLSRQRLNQFQSSNALNSIQGSSNTGVKPSPSFIMNKASLVVSLHSSNQHCS